MDAYNELLRQQATKWVCSECTLQNEQTLIKCAACNHDKNSATPSENPQIIPQSKSTQNAMFPCETAPKSPAHPKFQFGFESPEKVGKPAHFNSEIAESLQKIKLGGTALLVFGNNSFGSLGLGPEGAPVAKTPTLQSASLDKAFEHIACGALCVAAIDQSGVIWTWGPNDGGVLGRDTSSDADLEYKPQKLSFELFKKADGSSMPLTSKAAKVSVGDEHMVALLDCGTVFSWGSFKDLKGRIGHHVGKDGKVVFVQKHPVEVELPTKHAAVDIASGSNHAVVLDKRGQIFVFGVSNFSKRNNLRGDTPIKALLARRIYPALQAKRITSIFCGTHTVYAIDKADAVYCGGSNNYGQLGDGRKVILKGKHAFRRTLASLGKTAPKGEDTEEKKIIRGQKVCGGNHHSLVLAEDGSVYAFGRNASGLLGTETSKGEKEFDGVTPERSPSSNPLRIAFTAKDVSCGADHNLLVSREGGLFGFGFNSDYRLGLGNESELEIGHFAEIINSDIMKKEKCSIKRISAGSQFSCVLVEKGQGLAKRKKVVGENERLGNGDSVKMSKN